MAHCQKSSGVEYAGPGKRKKEQPVRGVPVRQRNKLRGCAVWLRTEIEEGFSFRPIRRLELIRSRKIVSFELVQILRVFTL